MADLPSASAAQPKPTSITQILDTHISLLKSHLDFLHTLKTSSHPPAFDNVPASSDHSTVLTSMISRAAIALHDARICGRNYRDCAPPQEINGFKDEGGVQEQEQEQEQAKTSPSLPLRHKRPSEVNVDAEVNGDDGEGGGDAATQPTKRRRCSSGRQVRSNPDSLPSTSNATTATSTTRLAPKTTTIEYTDITHEVNARLAAREERRRQRILQYSNGTVKRKRRSSLGDSLYFANSDDEGGEGGESRGMDGGMIRKERKMERARRISAGGTRKIKRLKLGRATDRYVGEAGTSVPGLGEMGVRDVGTVDEGVGTMAAGVGDGGTVEGAVRKEGVKVALNDVDVEGAPPKSGGNAAESKAKKRRRSSFVRGQGQDAEGGGNKHALDDRSTKRRRR